MNSVSTWFSEYRKHPFGPGATMSDYVATVVLAVVALFALVRIFKIVRKQV
jgi:ABC-type multidrug transport system permease subunit